VLLAPAARLGHLPGEVAMSAVQAMKVAGASRFCSPETAVAIVHASSPLKAIYFATSAPARSRGKARPSPTTLPAGTRKVLRTPQLAAARPLHLHAASTPDMPIGLGVVTGATLAAVTSPFQPPRAPPATCNVA